MNFDTLILQPFSEMTALVISFIPSFFIALAILIVGTITSNVIRKFTHEALKTLKFDDITDKLGLLKALQTGGIKYGPSMLLSHLIYGLLMIMVLIMTVKALGIVVGKEMITQLLAFIPNVFTGMLVLIIGMLVANVVASSVYMVARNTDMPAPDVLGRISKVSILVYVTIMYLREIGFFGLFTGIHHTIFIGGIVLTLALSFGLAGRTVAGKYLDTLKK